VPAQDDVVQENVIEEIATEVVPTTPTSPSPSSPVLDKCSALVLRVEGLENENAAQQWEIIKHKARVKKLERLNKVKSSKLKRLKKVSTSQRIESSDEVENVFNQGRISVDMETDEGVELVVDQEKDAEIEGRHADTQAEIYNIHLDHSSKVLSMQEDTEVQEVVEYNIDLDHSSKVAAASAPIPVAKPKVLKIAPAPAVSTRKRKGVVIRYPEEELHIDTPAETPTVKDKGKGIMIEDPKPMKKKDQIEMDAELISNPSSNPTPSTNPNLKGHNRRRSKQRIGEFNLDELFPPIVMMADQRTMAQLLQAPTEGYEDAIVVLAITADNFMLKHAQIWLEKEPPRSIFTWDDLVSKFIKQFFPPSKTINLHNEITNFQQRFDESFSEAWDRFKDLLRACPHHGFSELDQLDTFYNALNLKDRDSLNSAAGVVAKVSTNTSTSSISPDVPELKDMVKALLLDN
nr:reverse transcriptase domain-containing protein [Tanacetum cinerariifolium]